MHNLNLSCYLVQTWARKRERKDKWEKFLLRDKVSKWVSESCSVVSDSLWPHGLYSLWNSPGQNTGVGSCSLLQEIFSIQESNQGFLHCRQILYHLSHQGMSKKSNSDNNLKWSESHSAVSDSLPPDGLYSHGILQARILEWIATPFSKGSSQPKDGTQVSHIAGGLFTSWATR